jgi:hypothetical protein
MFKYSRIIIASLVLVIMSGWLAKSAKVSGTQAYKEKIIVFKEPVEYCSYFEHQDSTGTYQIHQYHLGGGRDSVLVYYGTELVSKFRLRGNSVFENKFVENRNGRIYREDSLSAIYGDQQYYNLYSYQSIWEKVYWPNGRMKTLKKHDEKTRNSGFFFQSWYENGLTSQVKTNFSQLDYYEQGNAKKTAAMVVIPLYRPGSSVAL